MRSKRFLLKRAANRSARGTQLALFVLGGLLLTERIQAQPPPSLLFFPLEDRSGSPEHFWLSEGVAMSIAGQVRAAGVSVVDREERNILIETADLPPNLPLSRASMIRVAQQAGVDGLVFGSFRGEPQNLSLTLQLLDLKSLRLGGEVSAHGPVSMLPEIENELAWNLLSGAGLCPGCSREDFRRQMRTIPNSAFSYYVRSLSAAEENDQIGLLQRAIALHKDFPEALYLVGRYYVRTGDCPKGIQYLESARRPGPHLAETLFMLGTCYLTSGKSDSAIENLTQFLSFSRSAEGLNNLGVAYLRKGDGALAADRLVEASRAAPNDPTIALNLAVLRYTEKNPPAALTLLEEAVRTQPTSGMLQFLLSEILASRGEKERSSAALAAAARLGINPQQVRTEDPRTWARVMLPWILNR